MYTKLKKNKQGYGFILTAEWTEVNWEYFTTIFLWWEDDHRPLQSCAGWNLGRLLTSFSGKWQRGQLTCTAQHTLGRHPSSVHLRELASKWSSSFKVISILWDPKPQPSCSSSEQHWRAIPTPEVAMVLFCLSRECLPYPFMPSPSSFNSGHSHKHSLGYRLSIDLPVRVWVLKT